MVLVLVLGVSKFARVVVKEEKTQRKRLWVRALSQSLLVEAEVLSPQVLLAAHLRFLNYSLAVFRWCQLCKCPDRR